MPTYKLVYFNAKGRAETARLAFHAAGIKFEDARIEKADWPKLKPNTPSGMLPYLEVDGKGLAESMAIARFVGREGGLMGKTNFEQAVVESLMDIVSGLLEKSVKVFMAQGEEKEPLRKEFEEKHLPETAVILDKYLGNKKFLASDEITLADLHFFSVFEFFLLLSKKWQEDHPKLKELHDRIAAQPRLAEYIKNRPKTEF